MDSSLTEKLDSGIDQSTLSKQYQTPPTEPVTSFTALKDRIKQHYELASDYYYSLWGEHIHHGYFLEPADTKERAQTRLIELLCDRAQLKTGSTVLDVGCGLGGTSSGKQVDIAVRLTRDEAGGEETGKAPSGPIKLGHGSAHFIELD
ncbi:MAG: hypothetical protein LQ338_007922, partial [Usnochroma carphineum]